MNIGIFSDTHNHVPEARAVLEVFVEQAVGHIIHCGDIGDDVMDVLAATCQEMDIRAHVAIGNTDLAEPRDVRFMPMPDRIETGRFMEWEADGKHIAILHGDQYAQLAWAMQSGRFDYILTGHTHSPSDSRAGKTRILNPGSAARPRASGKSAAILNPIMDRFTLLNF